MLRGKRQISQIDSPNPKKAKPIARLGTPQEMGVPMRSMLRKLSRELSAEGFVKTANFVDPNVPDPLPPVADLSQVFRQTAPVVQPPAPMALPPARTRGGGRRVNQQQQAAPDQAQAAMQANAAATAQELAILQAQTTAIAMVNANMFTEFMAEKERLKTVVLSEDRCSKSLYNALTARHGFEHPLQQSIEAITQEILTINSSQIADSPYHAKILSHRKYLDLLQESNEPIEEYMLRLRDTWKERNSLHDDDDQISEQSVARKMVESMSQHNSGFIKYVADEQVHKDKSIAERNNPEFGFPATLLKVIQKFNEYNLQLEHTPHQKLNRSFVTVDEGGHTDVGNDLSLQKLLPKDLKEVQVKHLSSGKMTSGKQLNSKSKPEDYGYKSCPKCWWQGKKNQQHFVHFHNELHPQVDSTTKKGGPKKTGKSPKKKESTGGNKQLHATMKQILKAVKKGAGEAPTANANSATTATAAPANTPA
jgi:arsenate reductase-like glutaredoxin family protein